MEELSKQVENTVGKGEIARYEQFLLFPECFKKACFPEESKGVSMWEWVKDMQDKFLTYLCPHIERLVAYCFTSSFSFSQSVSKKLVSQRPQKVTLCGNELR